MIDVKEISKKARALGHPLRIEILLLLSADELNVRDVHKLINCGQHSISEPTISKHLKVLAEAGFVTAKTKGACRFYSVRDERCIEAVRLLSDPKEKTVAFTTLKMNAALKRYVF